MLDTTALPPHEKAPHQGGGQAVEVAPSDIPDLRAPVGKDAGAPQVTDAAEDDGWHGDAEDDGKRPGEGEVKAAQAPVGARVEEVVDIELDADQKKLAEDAMRADEGV